MAEKHKLASTSGLGNSEAKRQKKSAQVPVVSQSLQHQYSSSPNTLPSNPSNAVNIAVASRALFNLDKEHAIFEECGLQHYIHHQIEHEQDVLAPGTAFPFIQALEHVNTCLRQLDEKEQEIFNIVLMTHIHAGAGVRLIKSVNEHGLNIERMCLTGGTNPVEYLKAYNIQLFLTYYADEVEEALAKGVAAATIFTQRIDQPVKDQLRVAFDLDAVLFCDEAERLYKEQGFQAFVENERRCVDEPIEEGPLKTFAQALGRMQKKLSANSHLFSKVPIRTYIVTSRSAASAGERAVKTLRSWGLDIDEMHFLAGASKAPILDAIKPHIFFDDQRLHVLNAQEVGTPAAHVLHGISKKYDSISSNIKKKLSFKT